MLIAQITDTHLKLPGKLAYKRVDTAQMLSACVGELLKLDPQPDLIVHTGDLTDFGLPEEYAQLQSDPGAAAGADPRRPRQSRRARGDARGVRGGWLFPGAGLPALRGRARAAALRRPRHAGARPGWRRAVRRAAGLARRDAGRKARHADARAHASPAVPHRHRPHGRIGLQGRDGSPRSCAGTTRWRPSCAAMCIARSMRASAAGRR